jgi:hypothetical protein
MYSKFLTLDSVLLFLSFSVIILKLKIILNQLFQQEIVNCIKNNEYFLYQEEGTFLISTTCLTSLDLNIEIG